MKKLGINEIREKFLKFFEEKEHLKLNSFSLVPNDDKSLLLINAGMAPMKNYFLELEEPPAKRVTTSQKCMRTGDLENVGITARHGTFFEMLGCFSFGNYFKEEIIQWSWEFVTEVLEIPKEKLYVTTHISDDEADEIWKTKTDLGAGRIYKFDKDNFWEIGVGPCGPSTEIFYDKGEEFGCGSPNCAVGCDCDRYMEFWNLVFIQFEKDENGKLTELDKKSIDTGMGLERMGTILQNVNSIFDVDTLKIIRDKVCKLSGKTYGANKQDDISIRILTDHTRSITFMIGDGILPSNEGRGYVLRKILRRTIVHGRKLGIKGTFLNKLIDEAIEISKEAYKELETKKEYINKIVLLEEKKFQETMEQGMLRVNETLKELEKENKKIFSGVESFRMYDTYGFPLDLLKEIVLEKGFEVDENGFKDEMEKQKQRAREAREETSYSKESSVFDELDKNIKTEFVGYDKSFVQEATILAIKQGDELVSSAVEKNKVEIITDKTPFYAESGGQKGDKGVIRTKNSLIKIYDCVKISGEKFVHIGEAVEGIVYSGEKCVIEIDREHRLDTARNHTATHILHQALKNILGNHVEQSGSEVSNNRLRFDFTHFETITRDELDKIENLVNEVILRGDKVKSEEMTIEEAKERGAIALFGDKYSNMVRVVSVGNFSIELCGGTHLSNSQEVNGFKIISESGIASGVRRIEAITGLELIRYNKNIENEIIEIASLVKANKTNVVQKIEGIIEENKRLQKELESFKSKMSSLLADEVLKNVEHISGLQVLISKVENKDMNELKELGDSLKNKLKSVAIVLIGIKEEKVSIVCMVTDDLAKKVVHAGDIVKVIAPIVDGRGGGRPNMAQAGGTNISKVEVAISKAKELVKENIKQYFKNNADKEELELIKGRR